jgi:hypothetical protein
VLKYELAKGYANLSPARFTFDLDSSRSSISTPFRLGASESGETPLLH